jgi:protocatechuate 4,5-dioxygenase beta chain/2'-aminobiphenyl-2,3-diol 1,2-dioxygenase large subunit
MSPQGIEERAERVFDGMKEIGRRVRADAPDVIVYVSSDHLMNFKLELQVPLAVGAADAFEPFGDMGIPKRPIRGHRAFAEDLVRAAASCGVDLAKAEVLRPDHGITIPNTIINRDGHIPVVPVYINAAMSPPPTPARAWALGEAIGRTVRERRPAGERVVIVGTGGLSHWICTPGQGRVNESFDREVMHTLCAGRGHELAQLQAEEITDWAGNGGLEVLCWICMAGAVPGWHGETVYYEPMPEWLTGMGGIAMRARAAA